jgi:hypothetical protein
MPKKRKSTSAGKSARKKASHMGGKRWSQRVTENSNAMDLEPGVFAQKDPRKIALSLKHSAEHSRRRKAGPYRSAMSMLTFYINRAGKDLPAAQRMRLETAKDELRKAFGKE